MRYIGDVHGKWKQYKQLIKPVQKSIQVGDLGIGFLRIHGPDIGETYSNPPHYAMKNKHRFIRGNHDNPAFCKKHSQWIPDGLVENNTMFVGGALSIDREWRHEGYSWWPDEECSIAEFNDISQVYQITKPEIMITHDCPEEVVYLLHRNYIGPSTRTRQAFQSMFECFKPKLWIFGHWHSSFKQTLYGTEFICLNELEVLDIGD